MYRTSQSFGLKISIVIIKWHNESKIVSLIKDYEFKFKVEKNNIFLTITSDIIIIKLMLYDILYLIIINL